MSEQPQRFSSGYRGSRGNENRNAAGGGHSATPGTRAPDTSAQVEADLAAIFGEDELLRHPPDPFEEKILTGRNSFTDLRDQLSQETDESAPSQPSEPPADEPGATKPTRPGSSDAQSRIAELRRDLAARSAARQAGEAPPAATSRFFRGESAATDGGDAPTASSRPTGSTRPSTRPAGAAGTAGRTGQAPTRRPAAPRTPAADEAPPTSGDDRITALRRDLASQRSDSASTTRRPAGGTTSARPRPSSEARPAAEPSSARPTTRRSPAPDAAEPPVRSRPATRPDDQAPSQERPAPAVSKPAVTEPEVAADVPDFEPIDDSLFITGQTPVIDLNESAPPEAAPEQRRRPTATSAPAASAEAGRPVAPRPAAGTPRTRPAASALVAPTYTPSSSDIISIQQLVKTYGSGPSQVEALRGVSLGVPQASLTAIMGPSGSGKSTLLHCVAGLEAVTAGSITVNGQSVSQMSAKQLAGFRRDSVGFVFQSFNLLPMMTVTDNICLPLAIKKVKADREWFDQITAVLRLTDILNRTPEELSTGQQQRVACARALILKPAVVLADEPTGNLDTGLADEMIELLSGCARSLNQTIVVATHDPMVAAHADQVYFLVDGNVATRLQSPSVDQILGVQASLADGRSGS